MTATYLTTAVAGLIEAARKDKSVLPVLADALEEAGFADAETLADLRSGSKAGRRVLVDLEVSEDDFFDRVAAAGFKGRIVRSQPKPYQVEWTGHTEIVHIAGAGEFETPVVTYYATPGAAVRAAESAR